MYSDCILACFMGAEPEMTVTFDSEWLEDVPAMLGDWLSSIADSGAKAIVILGPSVTDEIGRREVLATCSTEPMDLLSHAARVLSESADFTDWPLVSWQDILRGESDEGLNAQGWRAFLRNHGLISFVRVAMELPGGKAFEIYTFCAHPIRNRSEAAAFVWATMGAWPDVRRALALTRLKISDREMECLKCVVAGMSAKSIAETMGIKERTATYFVNSLADKFITTGRSTLPRKAAWLGVLD